MKSDYTYCLNMKEDCLHRCGCRRYVGNYKDEHISEIMEHEMVDESKCIPNYKDANCKNVFNFLDRFRLSTGKPFATGFTNKG